MFQRLKNISIFFEIIEKIEIFLKIFEKIQNIYVKKSIKNWKKMWILHKNDSIDTKILCEGMNMHLILMEKVKIYISSTEKISIYYEANVYCEVRKDM